MLNLNLNILCIELYRDIHAVSSPKGTYVALK